MGTGLEIEALQQGLARQAITQYAGAVCLQRGDNQILHDLDFSFSFQAGFRFIEGSLGLGHVEPGFVFVKTRFDVTDALKVLVEFVGVIFGQTTLHMFALCEHGIENAAVFGDGGLTLFQRHVTGREQLVENLNRVVLTAYGFATLIPTQRKPRTVTLEIRTVELD